jgi:type I restriction enzyme M protein
MSAFTDAKQKFDATDGMLKTLPHSYVTVNGKPKANLKLKNSKGEKLEEYYKWQFIYALINSGLYAKDYIGVEVRFPKGNKSSAALELDGAIFDDVEWVDHYISYWKDKKAEDLEWLNEHILAVIEFKRGDKEIEKVFTGQVKPAMKEKDPSTSYVMGIYYDAERLFLFHRRNGNYLRYDEAKNQKGINSKVSDLSLYLPDPYVFIPSFDELKKRVHKPAKIDRAKRSYTDLDIITSIATVQVQTALSQVLRTLDKAGLVNQRGYQILIETFALKIFDEKRNQKYPKKKLKFYIEPDEVSFVNLSDSSVQKFVKRMKGIRDAAESRYHQILSGNAIDWRNQNHVRSVVAVCQEFQDFSFVRSSKSDLYQLVFYNFANQFKRDESAQFLTPLPVIDFLVQLVNPRDGETVFDPCCGIGDFLSLSFVNAQSKKSGWQLDDANIYGVDLDEAMIMLATLNMLLNGDGAAKLFQQPDKGSILSKIVQGNPPYLKDLQPDSHRNGQWTKWHDSTKLMRFDVILTNPPFGEDRAYIPRTDFDRKVIEMYQTWHLTEKAKSIDLGIVFLENAVHCLKDEGRMGIVLSNSLASINKWRKIRDWFVSKMRVVALFDLPSNVFAETGVNTTLIVAYKPKPKDLSKLCKTDYSIFVRDIHRVGYEKRTSKRNVYFKQSFCIDESSFEIFTDEEGNPVVDEEFTETVQDFRSWMLGQEATLQRLFLKEA